MVPAKLFAKLWSLGWWDWEALAGAIASAQGRAGAGRWRRGRRCRYFPLLL